MTKRSYLYAELFSKQAELNSVVNKNWQTELTPDDFACAALDEFSEILGSVPWKWWKKASTPDFFNLKIEQIDILHFQISAIIQLGTYSPEEMSAEVCSLTTDVEPYIEGGKLNRSSFIQIALLMLEYPTLAILDEFLVGFGLSAEEASAFYAAKCKLNVFRQSEGYKTGVYEKTKAGVEDNRVLKESIEKFLLDKSMSLLDLEDEVLVALNKAYGIDNDQLSLSLSQS